MVRVKTIGCVAGVKRRDLFGHPEENQNLRSLIFTDDLLAISWLKVFDVPSQQMQE
jgi:hypothetical protein